MGLPNCFNATTLQNKNVRKNEKCARRDWRIEFFVGALTTQQKLKRSASARESSKCAKHYSPDKSEGGIQRKHVELEGNGHEDASWLDLVADYAIRILLNANLTPNGQSPKKIMHNILTIICGISLTSAI